MPKEVIDGKQMAKSKKDKRFAFGVFLTVIWILGVISISINQRMQFAEMTPNE